MTVGLEFPERVNKGLWILRNISSTGKQEWLGVMDQEGMQYVLEHPEKYRDIYFGDKETVTQLAILRDLGSRDQLAGLMKKLLDNYELRKPNAPQFVKLK